MDSRSTDSSSARQSTQFYSVLEYFKAHVTAIVTLATGALVLSISFLKDIEVTKLQLRWCLMTGWIFFTISIIAGVGYSYILTFIASDPADLRGLRLRKMLGKISIVLHSAFVLGIVCFLIFALGNVGMEKKDKSGASPTPTVPSRG